MTASRAAAPRVEVLADAEALAARAAAEVTSVLAETVGRRGRASFVLAGGSTPRRLYELLAGRPEALDWSRVALYWGDERCVDPASEASNYRLARETLLAGLPIPERSVHRIRGELAPAEAARRYATELEAELAGGPFDLVLLGLGADGHVASLFPGALPPAGELAAAVEARIEPTWRVTVTPAGLRRCRHLLFLVRGASKAAAVARSLGSAREGGGASDLVLPARGDVLWLLDREAAAGLPTAARPLW